MRKTLTIFIFFLFCLPSFSQSVLYFNFVTHDEETGPWNSTPFYNANRTELINLANYFQTNGITWNFQSDRLFLSNVLTKETAPLMALTNNKNILRWMYEDRGVQMDPHAHEVSYIYPDVAHLLDSIGLPESKVMGGTIYDGMNGINVWTNMSNGQNGVIFPWAFWQPDYLWGAGTPAHANDIHYFGVWNPQDTTNFLVHDTTQHIRYLATGCEVKIQDTSRTKYILADLKEIYQNVENQSYPANGFYMQTIFFEHAELNTAGFYDTVLVIADTLNAWINASSFADWKTLQQMYTEWETTYGAQMFQWQCGDFVGINENENQIKMNVYPNPVAEKLKFEINQATFVMGTEIEIYSMLGEKVYNGILQNASSEINVERLSNGVYFYYLNDLKSSYASGKFIKK